MRTNPPFNPIPGMPGGSVSGCIALQEEKPKAQRPRDSGAYCAAIADRIEPGWRERNPLDPEGLTEYRGHTIEISGPAMGEYWGTITHKGKQVGETSAASEAVALANAHELIDKLARGLWKSELEENPTWRTRNEALTTNELWAALRASQDRLRHTKTALAKAAGREREYLKSELASLETEVRQLRSLIRYPSLRNPKEQLGLFGEKQTDVEGFALVSPRGRPVEPVRPPKGTQERILPAEKPSREAMEELRRRELAERAERRKRKKNPVETLKRRLLTR